MTWLAVLPELARGLSTSLAVFAVRCPDCKPQFVCEASRCPDCLCEGNSRQCPQASGSSLWWLIALLVVGLLSFGAGCTSGLLLSRRKAAATLAVKDVDLAEEARRQAAVARTRR